MSDLQFNIRIAAAGRTIVAIDRFGIPENSVTFLFGESGIGKSLISRAIFGLLDQEEFDVTVNGSHYGAYRQSALPAEFQRSGFFVFQEPSTHLNPLLTIGSQIREGSLADAPGESAILQELWSGTGTGAVQDLLDVYPKPYRPSGGEKQRMLLVMAFKKIDKFLAQAGTGARPLFVFDEPTGSLDNRFRDLFLSMLFSRFRLRPFTVLLISHDYSMISHVQKEYGDLRSRISYKELASGNGRLTLQEFMPETYLDWLAAQQPTVFHGSEQSAERPLVSVESGAGIFGRRLMLSRDRNGLHETSLALRRGSMVYVKAPSGTGKTTLVKMMMGLQEGSRFRMALDGLTITEKTQRDVWQNRVWGKKMTMVFQHADEALNPRSTVRETFAGLPSARTQTEENVVRTLRELFDAEDITPQFLRKEVRMLSGGQKQRLNLLRGLYLDTDVLIVDEPLNGLDFVSTTRVIAMLHKKQRDGKGILVISHNEEIFDRQVPEEDVYYLRAV